MSVILVLIITSIVVAVAFLGAFFWAVKSGQYDDTYSPSVRMLFEEKGKMKSKEKALQSNPSTEEP